MNTIVRSAILAIITCPALSGAPKTYIRPIVASVQPSTEGYSSAISGGLATGVYLGTKETHELAFEWGYTHWDSEGATNGIRYTGRETFMPYTANYRFHVKPSASGNFSVYAGPSIGFANSQIQIDAIGNGVRVSLDESDWSVTFGGTVGVNLKLTDRIDLDIGFRYITIDGSEYRVGNTTFSTDDAHASVIYAGVGFRF